MRKYHEFELPVPSSVLPRELGLLVSSYMGPADYARALLYKIEGLLDSTLLTEEREALIADLVENDDIDLTQIKTLPEIHEAARALKYFAAVFCVIAENYLDFKNQFRLFSRSTLIDYIGDNRDWNTERLDHAELFDRVVFTMRILLFSSKQLDIPKFSSLHITSRLNENLFSSFFDDLKDPPNLSLLYASFLDFLNRFYETDKFFISLILPIRDPYPRWYRLLMGDNWYYHYDYSYFIFPPYSEQDFYNDLEVKSRLLDIQFVPQSLLCPSAFFSAIKDGHLRALAHFKNYDGMVIKEIRQKIASLFVKLLVATVSLYLHLQLVIALGGCCQFLWNSSFRANNIALSNPPVGFAQVTIILAILSSGRFILFKRNYPIHSKSDAMQEACYKPYSVMYNTMSLCVSLAVHGVLKLLNRTKTAEPNHTPINGLYKVKFFSFVKSDVPGVDSALTFTR